MSETVAKRKHEAGPVETTTTTDGPAEPPKRRHVLSVDRGSSSMKLAVYEMGPIFEKKLVDGEIHSFAGPDVTLHTRDYRASEVSETYRSLRAATPIEAFLALLDDFGMKIDAIGHRFVYGGSEHEEPVRASHKLLTDLALLTPFDPLHMPAALAAVHDIEALLPHVPQVVCFDTAFHRRMPVVAQQLPLPRELWSQGLRRYGFHGLSYESIVRGLGPAATRGAMVVAHLGSGASLAAIRHGRPVDTTMGLTVLGGLMMGTRPGDLDPGVLLYLLRTGRYTPEELDRLLTDESGLLGVSQISAEMHALLKRRDVDESAAEAVELFVYSAIKQIGALVAALNGLDTLVFTGGIGEHSAPIRSEIAHGLFYLGVKLDPVRNAAGPGIISDDAARVVVRVVPTQEQLMVARHAYTLVFASSGTASTKRRPGSVSSTSRP
jgi:acetate kinase